MKNSKQGFLLSLLASITLGLAPFNPPHIWSKLVLIGKGQASAFDAMDWLDVLLHGAPWLFLLVFGLLWMRNKKS